MADLQELFSRLKSTASQQPQTDSTYQPPAVSSPLFSPPISTPNPSGSGILSPKAGTPAQDAKAANLLNLLRFNGASTSSPSPLTAMQNVSAQKSANDAGSASNIVQPKTDAVQGSRNATPSVANPQDFLLNLLKQPVKASNTASANEAAKEASAPQADLPLKTSTPEASATSPLPAPAAQTPVREFGTAKSRETTPFEAPLQNKASGMFTYSNPFEQLTASTPQNRTPKSKDVNQDIPHPAKRQDISGLSAAASVPSATAISEAPVAIKQEPVDDTVPETWQASAAAAEDQTVKVYEFPMKPFVSIQVVPGFTPNVMRATNFNDIVRLKKDFDQLDRTLVSASKTHIVYAHSKSGGFRIIRQDSGRDKQAFKANQERIFNIQVKESFAPGHKDTILAAGANGSVFWTTVDLADGQLERNDVEAAGFVLPAVNAQEENTSGSPVKTRTKMSSRHSDLFAISRGKSIHLIAPSVAASAKYVDAKSRSIDSTLFFNERSHKISTGKACKDFTFSEDDTTLATLDKAGRIRFWDIRELSESAKAAKKSSTELKTPVLTFTASMASEKISPTSIMFLDKERATNKGIALRYLLVGFKQNHVLQLWDLGLGKPVQELHFPHGKDSDAICSISYHPKTSIITLAHPTRNSIYFIHLSAPRYHIPNMEQAKYVSMLAEEDGSLPKPDSTAILSGVRELSFGSKGQLRSVEMLTTPASNNDTATESEETLFELYAMHSTGVCYLTIKKADLGWNVENKVIDPVKAVDAGFIQIGPLTAPPVDAVAPDSTPAKAQDTPATKVESKPAVMDKQTIPISVAVDKEIIVESIEAPGSQPPVPEVKPVTTSYAAAATRASEAPAVKPAAQRQVPASASVSGSLADRSKQPLTNGDSVKPAAEISGLLQAFTSEFESLYRRIEGDRRIQDAAAGARQDAVLKLVSSTLTDNVERSLTKIVSTSIQEEVLPAVTDVFTALAERRLREHLNEVVGSVVPQEVRSALPAALALAFQEPETSQTLANHFTTQLTSAIVPVIASTIQQANVVNEERFAEQRLADASKIDRLANLVYGLSETLQTMSAGQAALQDQIEQIQQQLASGRSPSGHASANAPSAEREPEDIEVEEITKLMTEGQFESGTIQWLQSSRQAELFDKLFVRVNPQYLQKLSPLVKLSVSAAVSTSFEQNVDQRLDWLGSILTTTNLQDEEIAQVAPKIMNVLLSRIQGAYMSFAETDPANPVLRKFSNLSRQITEVRKLLPV